MRRFTGSASVIALVAVLAASAVAKPQPRADLTVSAGSVSAVDGVLKGSFVVQNKGAVPSGASSAALIVRAAGRKREAKRFHLSSLSLSSSRTVQVAVAVPSGLPAGRLPIVACADRPNKLRESAEGNNCRRVGTIQIDSPAAGATTPAPASAGSAGALISPIDQGGLPPSSVPTNPIPFAKDTPFALASSESNYWVYVPDSYDATHGTPTALFAWLHGCGGSGSGDIYKASPGGSQDWISIAVGGREGQCWDVNADQPKVLAAIADIETHFNIDPRRVILGGYSSGGDLAYRTAFYDAEAFAGLLIENSSPFRDTGSSQAASLAAAAWKFHVVHLAHLQDTTYPIAGVRDETGAMLAAGFPLTRVEVDGGHYDAAGDIENGHAVPGTNADIATYLLPHIDDGWLSPP